MYNFYIFGDSHADPKISHWRSINIQTVNIICHHLLGKLMYTFGRLGLNLLNIKNYGVKDNDYVCFCFGEIDCRNHVHKHITKSKDYKAVIDEIVESYFIAIKNNAQQFNKINICVYNVLPPNRGFMVPGQHPYPFLGTSDERKLYYLYMNNKIRELCELNNYVYFDIYDSACDKDGFLNNEISDGNVHLKDITSRTEFIKKLLNM